MDEIHAVFHEDAWVERDWAVLNLLQQMTLHWNDFTEKVKHRTRFLFMTREKRSTYDPDELSVAEFFERLAQIMKDTPEVWHPLPADSVVYRGRMTDAVPDPRKYGAKLLGTPDESKAAANRMSPAGIPMFYGSDSPETVIAEIGAHSSRQHAIVGQFRTIRDLMVIDLSSLPDVPSRFDEERRDHYYDILFLRSFAEDLARPVTLDGREHIDYVPTQIVTEYLRQQAPFQVDGLQFASAQCVGLNAVIFSTQDECVDEGDEDPTEHVLVLEKGTLTALRVAASIRTD